ncbi:MAG TPA: hypothetical protein VFM18_23585 [Methanosarcina sp.]|nr:hypothetical protein [Methanosarcina sp.]
MDERNCGFCRPCAAGKYDECEMRKEERLRDAAPELLEALEPFAKLLQSHNSKGDDNRPVFAINDAYITLGDLRKAVSAIAKAKGELK